jgi:hypothetical protein
MAKKEDLSPDFFSSPGLEETWAFIRTQVLEQLREENHNAENMLDLIMLERTSHLYGAIRQFESRTDEEGNPLPYMGPNYAKMMDMLVKMVDSLRQQRDKDFIIEEARAEVMHALSIGLKEALKELPAEHRKKVLAQVQAFMDTVD